MKSISSNNKKLKRKKQNKLLQDYSIKKSGEINGSKDLDVALSFRKKLLFRLVAIILPVLVILLTEIILRLNGYGGYPSFIKEIGMLPSGEKLCIVEPAASKPYFYSNPSKPGYAEQSSFIMPKPANTIRIFLIGESAAKGYPQPRNLSISAFLKAMLSDIKTDKNIEVIDLGTTAVASFPIIYMVRDALNFEPDIFVSYTGNNEFFGAYGSASVNSTGIFPSWMLPTLRWLNGLAIVQALYEVVKDNSYENLTLMERMIGTVMIPESSSLRDDAASNLKYSLEKIADEVESAGTELILCTTASNESGLKPLGEEDLSELTETEKKQLSLLRDEGEKNIPRNPQLAVEKLLSALAIAPKNAVINFLLGKAYTQLGDKIRSRKHFLAARKFDTMPWRPIDATESVIREVAVSKNILLCDIANEFRELSNDGASGWELVDDHVHLSLRGQAEAAKLILKSMTALDGPLAITSEEINKLPDLKYYATKLGTNIYDDYRVNHTLRVLFNVPFMKRSNGDAFNRFNNLVAEAEKEMTPEVLKTVREWQTMKPHAGGLRPITGMVARVLIRENRLDEALSLYKIAQQQVPDYTSWFLEYKYFELALLEQLNGSLSPQERNSALAGIMQGRFLLDNGFSETGLTERYMGRLHQLRGEWNEGIPFLLAARPKMRNEDLIACDHALAMSYIRTNRVGEAVELINNGIKYGGKFSETYKRILRSIQNEIN